MVLSIMKDDKGKGKVDDKGKGKVNDKRKGKAKKVKEANETNEAKKGEKEVVEVSSDEEHSSDEGFFGDEDLVLYNDVKYPLSNAEIRMFKERPTTSTSTRSRTPTAATRSRALIVSTSNAQAAFTPPRGYKKIALRGCVLGLKAPNDPNAPPPPFCFTVRACLLCEFVHFWSYLNMERGFLSLGGRGRGVKEKDKHGTIDVNTCVMEAATIGKNSAVYVNEVGHANINAAESTMHATESGNGNERVNVDVTCNPNVE
ncbi:hypothetical protein Tco_1383086 [Tanacetum coccineum]